MDAKPAWPFRLDVDVIWRDLDSAGHVNHAVYLTYMESARTTWYRAIRGALPPPGLDIILARAEVDYRAPASLGDRLVVEMTPGRVGETSFGLDYRILDRASGKVLCEGKTVQVSFDYARQAKMAIPAVIRAALSR